jgi:hypothetical protein
MRYGNTCVTIIKGNLRANRKQICFMTSTSVFVRARKGAVKTRAEMRNTTRMFIAGPILTLFLQFESTCATPGLGQTDCGYSCCVSRCGYFPGRQNNYFAGVKGDYSVPVPVSPGNLNTSLARSLVTRRTISFAFSASTPVSLETYANCVGAANRVPDA